MTYKQFVKTGVAASLLMLLGTGTIAQAQTTKTIDASEHKAFSKMEVTSKADAKALLQQLPGNNKASENYEQYQVVDVEKDELNYKHYTLKPKVDSVYADNQVVKVHVDDNEKVVLVNGDINAPKVSFNNSKKISQSKAVNKAFKAIGQTKKSVKNLEGHDIVNKAELGINADKNKLVYNVELIYLQPTPSRWQIQVDAQTGKVLAKKNILHEATGTGIGTKGDTKTINISAISGGYSLTDTTHTGKIITYDAKTTQTRGNVVTSTSTLFNTTTQRAAVDAHYYADVVYDYYLNTHNRDSYNGKGAAVESVVHFDKNYNNAAWTGQYMIYGDGDGVTFSELSGAKDVIAHELTHAVTETSSNLVYENQPGALNESFSDVFGYFVDPDDWLMGEDIYTPKIAGDALRSLSDPAKYDQPAHMNNYQNLPNTKAGDWGGVHINSGIPNKAAYNTIQKIGKVKAEKIYYRALTQYLTTNSQFVDAKKALVQSATDLYGATEAAAVTEAWNAVGVTN
ncbi:M4 family metallopeptidase [Kurthia populi]|uniref:Neutral metalloproteinase n=1 Tax=Kurthia populi TaxID=1562132 RepID=A0ABW5XX80_9BACL